MMEGPYIVQVNPANCKECGYCMEMCAPKVFGKSNSVNANGFKYMTVVNSEDCDGCEKCVLVCPDFAITVTEKVES
jgi:formate dehydrogenase beta subunit